MEYRAKIAIEKLAKRLDTPLDRRHRSYFVEKSGKGRRLVITDIHGCFQTFAKLLKKIKLKKSDQLFILGDMVDRGPYSLLVLDKIWELLAAGYQVYPLRGNHEQLFLDFHRSGKSKLLSFAERQYARHLLEGMHGLPAEVERFFDMLPIYYETPDAFLVHAGFNTDAKKPFKEWKDMLWIRSFDYDGKKLNEKMVIHGHVPVSQSAIEKALRKNREALCLDNGCVKAGVRGYGKLLCYDMDTRELVSQKNTDLIPYREKVFS